MGFARKPVQTQSERQDGAAASVRSVGQRAGREGSYSRGPVERLQDRKQKPGWRLFLERILEESRDELMVILFASLGALVRAMGVQVQSGYAGLLFTCGRASKVLDHGFRPLIPFLQQVAIVPIRSRTMDLPSQRIVNRDGLVYLADANLVYHVHDVFKAVIEIDDLEDGMLQMLTLGVQEVLRETTLATIGNTEKLGKDLEAVLSQRLADWGVTVDKAGFPSLTPSRQTLRITQLHEQVGERQTRYLDFRSRGHSSARSILLVGTRRFPVPKRKQLVRLEFARSTERRQRARFLAAIAKAKD